MAKEQKYRCGEGGEGIGEDPQKMGDYVGKIACEDRALHLYGVDEGEGVGDLLEDAAYKLQIKPRARQPGGQVCQQGAADPPYLFVGQDAAKQQTERNEENGNGENEKDGKEDIYRDVKPEKDGNKVACEALRYGKGDDWQGVAEDEIK